MAIRAGETPARYVVAILLGLLAVAGSCVAFFLQGKVLGGFLLIVVFFGMGWVFFPAILNGYRSNKRKYQFIVFGGVFLICLLEIGSDIMGRRMDIYVEAKRDILNSAAAKDVFGSHLKIGWFVALNADVSDQSGHAEIEIPISGTQAEGTLIVVGTKSNGIWSIDELYAVKQGTKGRVEIEH